MIIDDLCWYTYNIQGNAFPFISPVSNIGMYYFTNEWFERQYSPITSKEKCHTVDLFLLLRLFGWRNV